MTDPNAAPASAPAVPAIVPRVLDIFHGDKLVSDVHRTDPVGDFRAMANAGIWGMIHKATQGLGVDDPAYAARVRNARLAGFLTGAYHFNTGDTPASQVNHFFDAAKPDAQTMMALDFEDNRASQMSLGEAVEFIHLADEKLGRKIWVYSGNRIKELIVNASPEVRETFASRPLWLCEYGPVARMTDVNGHPLPWTKYTIWQFTGDGIGPKPHALPGMITTGIDINSFAGTRDDLIAVWTVSVPVAAVA